jgi:hypothetical protein
MLSVNGSPLANPLSVDLSTWLSRKRESDNDEPEGLKREVNGLGTVDHTKTFSIIVRSTSSQPPSNPARAPSRTASTKSGVAPIHNATKPVAALVSVPTADGHLLEFDPFRTSPGEIDALEGITNSAKKKAKEDMRSLVKEAVERWRID